MPNLPADLDRHDRAILRLLQSDATLSLAAISEAVGLSSSPCWRRIQRMREAGYIMREVALLDPVRLGFEALVFVQVKLSMHGRQNLADFTQRVKEMAEVMECHTLMGEYDFLLRVLLPEAKSYEAFFFEKLSTLPGVQELHSSFALSAVKAETALPI